MAIGFIQLLCMTSLQTYQIKITVYDTHYIGLGETRISISGVWNGRFVAGLLG